MSFMHVNMLTVGMIVVGICILVSNSNVSTIYETLSYTHTYIWYKITYILFFEKMYRGTLKSITINKVTKTKIDFLKKKFQ